MKHVCLTSLLVLICLGSQTALAQKQDSLLQRIDELKRLYQKKDIENSASLSKQIHEILISRLPIPKADTATQPTGLTPVSQVLKDATFGTTTWSLSIQYKSAGYEAITHEDFAKALDAFAEYSPQSECQQAQTHKTEMKEAFKWFTLYCDNIAAFLPNTSKRPVPFRFADKNGKKCVIMTDMASSSVYNTLRSTSSSRASKVLTSCFIPKVKYLYQAFESTDFAYFGFTIVYGSKDFSEKSDALNLKAEMLAFVAPRDKCKQFIEGSLTESEFVEGCDVFLTDRDMMFDYKKVKLKVE